MKGFPIGPIGVVGPGKGENSVGNKPRLRCWEHATHAANHRQINQAATCQGDRWVGCII